LDVNVAIRKNEYSGDLDFIILFLGIMPLHAINLEVMSLFADSPFMFLTILIDHVIVSDVFYQFE